MCANCPYQYCTFSLEELRGQERWKHCQKSNLLPGLPGEKAPPVVLLLLLDHLEKQTKGTDLLNMTHRGNMSLNSVSRLCQSP